MCEKLSRQPAKPLPMWLAALSFGRRVATLGRDRIGVGSSTSFPCGEFIGRWKSYRHHQPLRLSELFLVGIESEKFLCAQIKRSGHMKNIKTAVPTRQGVRGRDALRFVHNMSEIADHYHQPSTCAIRFKLCPK